MARRRYSLSNDYYSDWFSLTSIIIRVDIEFKFTREFINHYVDRRIRDTNF